MTKGKTTTSEEKYWNLAQAAAWVVYCENGLVEDLVSPEPGAFGAIGMYPTMWPKGREAVGTLDELHNALASGRLTARGYRINEPNILADIPKREWANLHLAPPHAYDASRLTQKIEPWRLIQVDAADLKRLWRSKLEVKGRAKYDHELIRNLYDKAKADNPDMTQNEWIGEVQLAYAEKKNGVEPSRSTIQRAISK